MFLDVSGGFCGIRGRQSPEKFRFFCGGDGQARVHHHPNKPLCGHPPHHTSPGRARPKRAPPHARADPPLAVPKIVKQKHNKR